MPTLNRRHLLSVGTALAAALPLRLAAQTAATAPTSQQDAYTVMLSDPRFRTWVTCIEVAGLEPSARGAGPYTIFAPTEAAFDRYPTLRQDFLPNQSSTFPDTSRLIQLVRSHVIYGSHPASEFKGKKETLRSVYGSDLTIDGTGSGVPHVTWQSLDSKSGNASLSAPVITASNGLIYPLDDVLLTMTR